MSLEHKPREKSPTPNPLEWMKTWYFDASLARLAYDNDGNACVVIGLVAPDCRVCCTRPVVMVQYTMLFDGEKHATVMFKHLEDVLKYRDREYKPKV
jgi:hypothetical protein